MSTLCSQAAFLSNRKNKDNFIKLLISRLQAKGVRTHQAEHDADVSIVNFGLEYACRNQPVCIVGQDSDLVVLVTALYKNGKVWFRRPSSKAISDHVHYIPDENKRLRSDVLLFAHAVSGCDATSALFRIGKLKAYKILDKDKELRKSVSIFYKENASKKELVKVGEKFIMALYGGAVKNLKAENLDELRFKIYTQKITVVALDSKFDLSSLPPTTAAATQHIFRVYHQIQTWLGFHLDPTAWGWSLERNALVPIKTTKEPAPQELLKLVYCKCRSECSNNCECKRADLVCSSMCRHCEGITCTNLAHYK